MSPLPGRSRARRLAPWLVALALFYAAWLGLIISGDLWQTVREHWGIAVAMAAGSYVAGATPMGGGTVGFPILVLLFHLPATLGRDFSFAVQSIGMTSAALFILCQRQPLERPMLGWAIAGSSVGTPLGILCIAPLIPPLLIKIVFAVIWASFGILHLYRMKEIAGHEGLAPGAHRFDRTAGLLVGFLAGATIASITGVGIDMVIYAVLVLLCQADLKIAIPTSVVIMAFTSLLGSAVKGLFTGFQPGVFEHWLAAAPIVALGAPLGAFVVAKVGRELTLFFVSFLCVGQFIWTMSQEWPALGWAGLGLSILGVLISNLLFEWLHRCGNRLNRRQRVPKRSALACGTA